MISIAPTLHLVYKIQEHMGQVTKVRLSCYLVLLSNDSKTRQQDSPTFMSWPIWFFAQFLGYHRFILYRWWVNSSIPLILTVGVSLVFVRAPLLSVWLQASGVHIITVKWIQHWDNLEDLGYNLTLAIRSNVTIVSTWWYIWRCSIKF